jgi:hypothetical protein
VKSQDERQAGRAFSDAILELALGGYAGFHATTPPTGASAFGVYWPALVPADEVQQVVHLPDGSTQAIEHTQQILAPASPADPGLADPGPADPSPPDLGHPSFGPDRVAVPLGELCGARSGDKGGNANVGFWARDARSYEWLRAELTVERFKELLTEAADLDVLRYELPNLNALNFVVVGLIAPGVAATARPDAQAKGLGEYLRSRTVLVPAELLA